MIYLYLFGFAAVVVFFMWLGCRWEPDPTARLMAEEARQSHPSMRAHRAAVKAGVAKYHADKKKPEGFRILGFKVF